MVCEIFIINDKNINLQAPRALRCKNMENVSILDKIIDNQQAEAVENLDAVEIINNLFTELSARERDVVVRRHGLHSGEKETLEKIGSVHNLTRERIRQIETTSVKKLQGLQNLDKYISTLKKIIFQLLEEHGGMMEKEYLMQVLVGYSLEGVNINIKDEEIHKNYINFLITKLLHQEFEEVDSSRHIKDSYKLKFQDITHLEEISEEIHGKIEELKKIHNTVEAIRLIKDLNKYDEHKDKLNIKNSLNIAKVIKSNLYQEDHDEINQNKVIYSILRAAKKIEQNKFGQWGMHNWREIRPKTINDKIYLVLKNQKEPLHFGKIADLINDIQFDHKQANAATVHNELILDKKYVLVGRGLYGLREWGFKKGNVVDVIEEILAENGPLTRDQIIDKVLEKRMVKKATIILALMNKDKFDRAEGRYTYKN